MYACPYEYKTTSTTTTVQHRATFIHTHAPASTNIHKRFVVCVRSYSAHFSTTLSAIFMHDAYSYVMHIIFWNNSINVNYAQHTYARFFICFVNFMFARKAQEMKKYKENDIERQRRRMMHTYNVCLCANVCHDVT